MAGATAPEAEAPRGTEAASLAAGRTAPTRAQVAITALVLAVLAATNKWLSWDAGYRLLTSRDELSYRAIAEAAPHFPTADLPVQHAQRFPFHWLIGELSNALGANVEGVYFGVTGVVILVLLTLLWRVVASMELPPTLAVLCIAVFVLNTYALRFYVLAPGQVGDLIFECGVVVLIGGLLARRYPLVLLGLVVATLARQTAVPVSVVAAVWWWLGRRGTALLDGGNSEAAGSGGHGRGLSRLRGLLPAVALVVVSVALFEVLKATSASFSADTTPGTKNFTVLGELEQLPSGLHELAEHVLRSINGLFTVAALIATALVVRRRSGATSGIADPDSGVNQEPAAEPLGRAFWGSLAVGASIALQPLAFSAGYAAHNETRLAVLALPAFTIALAVALRAVPRGARNAARAVEATAGLGRLIVLLTILAVGSLHHLYTVIGPSTAGQSAALQFATALGCAGALWRVDART